MGISRGELLCSLAFTICLLLVHNSFTIVLFRSLKKLARIHKGSGRTSTTSMVVRPLTLWTYVHSPSGRTTTGLMNWGACCTAKSAVSAIEWKHANSFAPSSVLKPPETLDFTFNTLMEASLELL